MVKKSIFEVFAVVVVFRRGGVELGGGGARKIDKMINRQNRDQNPVPEVLEIFGFSGLLGVEHLFLSSV